MNKCVFKQNSAFYGGALGVSMSGDLALELNVTDCAFEANKATDSGGALWLRTLGKVTLKNSTFTNNRVMGRGGALYLSTHVGQTTVEVNDSDFDGDAAEEAG